MDYNVYVVRIIGGHGGFADIRGRAAFQSGHPSGPYLLSAHELGHLLTGLGNHGAPDDLMSGEAGSIGCEVTELDWDNVQGRQE